MRVRRFDDEFDFGERVNAVGENGGVGKSGIGILGALQNVGNCEACWNLPPSNLRGKPLEIALPIFYILRQVFIINNKIVFEMF